MGHHDLHSLVGDASTPRAASSGTACGGRVGAGHGRSSRQLEPFLQALRVCPGGRQVDANAMRLRPGFGYLARSWLVSRQSE